MVIQTKVASREAIRGLPSGTGVWALGCALGVEVVAFGIGNCVHIVRSLEVSSGNSHVVLHDHHGTITAVDWCRANGSLASSSDDHFIIIYTMEFESFSEQDLKWTLSSKISVSNFRTPLFLQWSDVRTLFVGGGSFISFWHNSRCHTKQGGTDHWTCLWTDNAPSTTRDTESAPGQGTIVHADLSDCGRILCTTRENRAEVATHVFEERNVLWNRNVSHKSDDSPLDTGFITWFEWRRRINMPTGGASRSASTNSCDRALLVTCGGDGSVRLWREQPHDPPRPLQTARCLNYSDDSGGACAQFDPSVGVRLWTVLDACHCSFVTWLRVACPSASGEGGAAGSFHQGACEEGADWMAGVDATGRLKLWKLRAGCETGTGEEPRLSPEGLGVGADHEALGVSIGSLRGTTHNPRALPAMPQGEEGSLSLSLPAQFSVMGLFNRTSLAPPVQLLLLHATPGRYGGGGGGVVSVSIALGYEEEAEAEAGAESEVVLWSEGGAETVKVSSDGVSFFENRSRDAPSFPPFPLFPTFPPFPPFLPPFPPFPPFPSPPPLTAHVTGGGGDHSSWW